MGALTLWGCRHRDPCQATKNQGLRSAEMHGGTARAVSVPGHCFLPSPRERQRESELMSAQVLPVSNWVGKATRIFSWNQEMRREWRRGEKEVSGQSTPFSLTAQLIVHLTGASPTAQSLEKDSALETRGIHTVRPGGQACHLLTVRLLTAP